MPPDTLAGVGYTHLREGAVARTVEVTGSIMVDVDANDRILGVETLDGEDWQAALVTLAMTGRLAIPRKHKGGGEPDGSAPTKPCGCGPLEPCAAHMEPADDDAA